MDIIIGQQHTLDALQRALDAGKVHHAWIFHGPRGVGKFTTAVQFATILLDPEAGPDLTGHVRSNPEGATARLVQEDRHPDLHIIRKELALHSSVTSVRNQRLRNIPIDVLRERVIGGVTSDDRYHPPPVSLTPSRGHAKVFIIDEAELLDPTGQNAMLNTLEEPPAGTYIILVTTQPDRLLATIRSRAQRVAFMPLTNAEMHSWQERELARPDSPLAELPEEQREWIVRFAEGSPGLVVMAAEDGLYAWREQLAPMMRELSAGQFPASMGEVLAGLVDEFAAEWVKRHENASKEMANLDGARRVFQLLSSHASRRLHRAIERGDEPDPWLSIIERLREAESQLRANVNLKLVMHNLVAQWSEALAPAGASQG